MQDQCQSAVAVRRADPLQG